MSKFFLALIVIFMAMGLYAGNTDEKVSEPTQRTKNLNEAVERWSSGKATKADIELIKSEDEPFIKGLQKETVYGFKMDIDNPSYHFLAMGGASFTSAFSSIIDLYMIKHCTNDLSKITPEDFQNIGASKEYGQLLHMKYGTMGTTKDTYKKYIQAVKSFNCADPKAFFDYLGLEIVNATVLTKFVPNMDVPQTVEFSFKNDIGDECKVYGKTLKYNNGKFSVNLSKQKCDTAQESTIEGYASPFKTNNDERVDGTFTTLNVGDKVEIFKSK